MEIFINEKSLQEQFNDFNIEEGIHVFISGLKLLSMLAKQSILFKSNLFFCEKAVTGLHLGAILPKNKSLQAAFALNLKNAKSWQSSQMHSIDTLYEWDGERVSGSSVAELAERKIQNQALKGILFCFISSSYSEKSVIDVIKESKHKAELDCVCDEVSLRACLKKYKLIPEHDKYDEKLRVAPFDDQTVLVGEEFEITQYKNKGRRAYRLKGKHQLWAVDRSESHQFGKPHIEVFSEVDGQHLGTSVYDRIDLDTSYKVNGRTIDLEKTYPIPK